MSWVDIFEATGIRSCSARSSVSSISILPEGNITTDSGAAMFQITLDVWQSNTDTALYTFSDGGIKVSEDGDYLVSASLYFNSGITNDNHGIHVLDTDYIEVMSAHYYNIGGYTSGGCGCAPKIMTLSADTVLYLCGRTRFSSVTPVVTGTDAATFLTIVKLS